jgi:hypothetical protein
VYYDFIYKNKNIINSFYAQKFEGLIKNINKKDQISKEQLDEKSLGYSNSYTKSNLKQAYNQEQNLEIDPQEIITIDILSELMSDAKEISTAQNNEIVHIQGNAFFMNKAIFDTFLPNLIDILSSMVSKQDKKAFNLMKKMLNSIDFEPVAYIKFENNIAIGTIKEEFLAESILSYFIKHGKNGLADINVIAIKEDNSNQSAFKLNDFQQGALEIANMIQQILVPSDAVTITPIAIYRKIQ